MKNKLIKLLGGYTSSEVTAVIREVELRESYKHAKKEERLKAMFKHSNHETL